jgi:hypothetical protein
VLRAQGWGIAPVYVGQQAVGGPGSHILTAAQGTLDGQNATQLMTTAGFTPGSFVYLDIETGGPASPAIHAYATAWIASIQAQGTFQPAIYCSFTTAPSMPPPGPGLRYWNWHLGPIQNPAPPTFPVNHPSGCGFAAATVWQHTQNHPFAFPGSPAPHLTLDLDVASVPDPSQ